MESFINNNDYYLSSTNTLQQTEALSLEFGLICDVQVCACVFLGKKKRERFSLCKNFSIQDTSIVLSLYCTLYCTLA